LSRDNGRRGSALLTVLWLGAALSAIALAVSLKARTEIERSSSAVEAARARMLANGAAERALAYVVYGLQGAYAWPDGRPRFWRPGMPYLRFRFQTGEAVVELIPETSKLNVNRATAEELTLLAMAAGLPRSAAMQLAQAIIDWREPSPMGLLSPFDAIYLRRKPSFRAPHASVQQIDELMNVAGMTPELFYGGWTRRPDGQLTQRPGLRDCLTVYAEPGRAMDINTVPIPALIAAGAPPEAALALERLRSQRPVTPETFGAAAALLGPAAGRVRLGGDNVYTIRATARPYRPDRTLSDVRRTVAMTVQLYYKDSASATRILAWQENAYPSPEVSVWIE